MVLHACNTIGHRPLDTCTVDSNGCGLLFNHLQVLYIHAHMMQLVSVVTVPSVAECKSFYIYHSVCPVYYTKPPPIPYTKPPPIPCAKLHVENGQVFLNKTEKEGIVQATIFCNEGFILEGKDTLNCTKSGKWDGEVPKCISE